MTTYKNAKTALYPKAKGASAVFGESNDCTVRAASNATGIEYQKIHDIFSFYGRPPRKGAHVDTWMKSYGHPSLNLELVGSFGTSATAGLEVYKFGTHGIKVTEFPGITIKKFIKDFPKGKFVCMSNKHAFAIVDGELIDADALLLNTRITTVYKVKS